nr:putative olfactory receptor 10D3 [Vicugna pacos]
MEIKNHTSVKEFTLSGIPHAEGQQTVPSVVFPTSHLCALLGNPLILVAEMSDSCLHTPMYFFLCNLSVLDIGFSAVSTPKMFANQLVKNRVISLGGCVSQVFFCHFLGCSECLLYTVMAYDRFVAICHPLRYTIIVNRHVCAGLAAGIWCVSSFQATMLTALTFHLPYCGSNEIDYFFCDIFPVVKLACGDTLIIETVSFTNTSLLPTMCFLLILTSFVHIIITILQMRTAEGGRKAASTRVSHLSEVMLFFGPCALIYSQPSLSEVLVTPVQIFGNVITPTLNPSIYTLTKMSREP